ncbi:hypothetical protein Pyrde_1031 [Pyrodictium delaneyi]|uniref:Uncharacterized protein n=1 Tax=Pyrodictium delaneyi TaxID=1273541 RepID=A0A0P0N354_9CREN|nr:hypothetical protein [Pyrodictium delaneyi]ALL01079.1 hypothetical protein Pyrde_1031 [Pyrodictium delaneyi]
MKQTKAITNITFRRSLHIALALSLYGVIEGLYSKNITIILISLINIVLFMIVKRTLSW